MASKQTTAALAQVRRLPRVQELREALGWSRAELADEIGVHPATIYSWEIGESDIPDEPEARLCELFGVNDDHLMGRRQTDGARREAILLALLGVD